MTRMLAIASSIGNSSFASSTIALENASVFQDTVNTMGEITMAKNADSKDVEAAALKDEGVIRALDGKTPKKVIVVPNRIVNIVA